MKYSPDGKSFAVCGQGGIQIFNSATGSLVSCIPEPNTYIVNSVAFSKDGKTLAIGGGVLEIRNVSTGSLVSRFRTAASNVFSVAFSPDETMLVAGGLLSVPATGAVNGVLEVWNVASGTLTASLNTAATATNGAVRSVAFSPDGKTLAVGGVAPSANGGYFVGVLELWTTATFKLTASLSTGDIGTYEGVESVAFSPDGKTLASAGVMNDLAIYGLVELWNASTGAFISTLVEAENGGFYSVTYSSDGKTFVAGGGDLDVFDVATWTATQSLPQYCYSVALSPDGKTLAAGGDKFKLWDVQSGNELGPVEVAIDRSLATLAISPDGKVLAGGGTYTDPTSGMSDGRLALWDSATGMPISLLNTTATQSVNAVAFSSDGKLLAVGGQGSVNYVGIGVVEIWNVPTKTLVATLKTTVNASANAIAFSPDGSTLAVGGMSYTSNDHQFTQGALELWDVPSASLIGPLATSATNIVNCLGISPDGKTLAVGGNSNGNVNGTVELWSISTRSLITNIGTSAQRGINSLAFSPDGTILADAGSYGTDTYNRYIGIVETWNASTGAKLASQSIVSAYSTITSVAFTQDGSAIFASEQMIHALGTASLSPLASFSSYDGLDIDTLTISSSTGQVAYATQWGGIIVGPSPVLSTDPVTGLAISPTSVVGGGIATGTVTLANKAPNGGATVNLTSSVSSVVVPASVTVASGATTATFTITTQAVSSNTTATITATSGGVSSTATLTVTNIVVSSLSLNPTSLQGGASSTGTLTLSQPAPSGGFLVSLASDNGCATVPKSISVASGLATATFTVSTTGVNAQTSVSITAGTGSAAQSATLVVAPATIASLTLSPNSVVGGTPASATVSLNGPAGIGGTTVTLSSNNPGVTVPSSVTVAAGTQSASVGLSTSGVNTQATAILTATLNGQTKSGTLTITVAGLAYVTVNPTSVPGGLPSTGTLSLTGNAGSNGLKVALSSNNAAASVPATVTVTPGQNSSTFTVKTVSVSAQKIATITAKAGSVSKAASLTVTPPSLASLSLNPTTVAGGTSSTGTVSLSRTAPAGGIAVKLSSSTTSATVPSSVTVASGKTSATFTVKSLAVAAQKTATISATFSDQSQTAMLTITAPTLTAVTLSPTSVKGGKTSIGTVTITSAAPAGGLKVSLKSDSSAATVPSTATIAAGKTSATFTVKSFAVTTKTTATISATMGTTSKTASLTIS